nr:hypothetical protein [Tanacetum cinerariifolium]
MVSRFEAQELEINSLKARIKMLEEKDRGVANQSRDDSPIKGRRLDEVEEAAEKGSNDTEEMINVLTSMDATTVLSSGIAEVPTGSGSIPTAGKEKMIESETPEKKKIQEQMDIRMARQVEEEMEREAQRMNEQITRDAEIARIDAKEELQIMIDGLDRSNEKAAKYLQEYHQFATELPIERRIELISDQVRYQDNYAKVHKYQSQQRKPLIKKQQREFYTLVLRNQAGWKAKDFKGMTLEEIKENFDPVWKQIHDFIPIGSKEEAERFKRKGIRFEQESVKKLKTSEEVKATEEVPEEKVKKMIQLIPVEEVYVEALQVKHPIIDWKVRTEGQRSYWKITRLGGSSASYQIFVHMLKHLDREDLNLLWRLVKETLSIRPPVSDKEMKLWLYGPDDENQLWTRTQNLMHAPVEWKLYDTCGVHHVTSKDKKYSCSWRRNTPSRRGRIVRNKMNKAFPLPVMEFQLPREVPTASEESSHWQKKKDATGEKIALLMKSSSNCQSKSYDSYAKLSEHSGKRFTLQQKLSTEQALWFRISNPTIESSNKPPVKVEVPSELPKELLVYVRDTCPNAIKLSAKKVTTTPKNNVKKVKFAEPLTSSSNIKQVESSKTSYFNTPVLSPNKVETQPRKVNKKNHVVEPIRDVDVKHSLLKANSELICATCKKSMFDGVHDMCLLDFVENVNNRVKSTKKHKNKIFGNLQVVLIVLWYLDSGCSKHMTGNRSQLMNFISKFLGTVRFENDHIARIMGYGDYQLGNVTISRVYYVEWLGHNLFSVGQFCDADLEVAFRKNTCFIHNLEASKTKIWLWHHRLSNLNFSMCIKKSKKSSHQPKAEDTNQEKLYLLHMDLCGLMRVASINRKSYILVIVEDYSRFTWVRFLRSKDEAPENDIVERQNRTLVEAARTMLIFSKALLFLWAEVINTACYTQNHSLIHLRYNKTPYELMQDKKLDLSFFHVFGALCYPTNDNGDLGKLDAKANIGIFVSYAPAKKAFRIYNKRTQKFIETIHVTFDELTAMASEQFSSGPELYSMTLATSSSRLVSNPVSQQPSIPLIRDDWDGLFQPMFDEYFYPPSIIDSLVQEAPALRAVFLADSLVSTSIN